MSKYLITGGAGFIGSSIAEHLIKEGHFVRVLDNFFSGKEENLDFTKGIKQDKFELIRGDITNSAIVIKPAKAWIMCCIRRPCVRCLNPWKIPLVITGSILMGS